MYIRTLHRSLTETCYPYKVATFPLVWIGRKISKYFPESLKKLIDRIACAIEITLPKIGIVLGSAAIALCSCSYPAAMAAFGSLVWFANDVADYLQFYPYDYLEDMSSAEFKNENDLMVIRNDLVERITFYLSKEKSNNSNVLILGPAGCGKTSIAHSIAGLIKSENCLPQLKNKTIYKMRIDKLMANVQRPGDFEMRFVMLLSALQYNKDVIVFIDEAHQLLDRRGNGNTSLANLLKPFLTKGLKCLAATTKKEYVKHIEEDEGFAQRFNIVQLSVPNQEICIKIMQVRYPGLPENAAKTAIIAAQRLYPKNALPRSGLLLLENTIHATKMLPTEEAILQQEKFEAESLGS